MGKDLKGKKLGKGICQRKDGLYSARCTRHGQSYGRYFKTVKEAKQWLKEFSAKPKSKRGMTVDQWYQYWMTNLISDLAPNTRRNYAERYSFNVAPYIGDIYMSDYIGMVEQAAVCADPELYSYILKAVTEGTTFVVLKSLYSIPCERDMFYDRRRKFYWVLSGVR